MELLDLVSNSMISILAKSMYHLEVLIEWDLNESFCKPSPSSIKGIALVQNRILNLEARFKIYPFGKPASI